VAPESGRRAIAAACSATAGWRSSICQAASQPMSNADGTVTLVFNGEIYNHADVRRDRR
jgi:asparagine synthetase B (glutamine-hydrolysing)